MIIVWKKLKYISTFFHSIPLLTIYFSNQTNAIFPSIRWNLFIIALLHTIKHIKLLKIALSCHCCVMICSSKMVLVVILYQSWFTDLHQTHPVNHILFTRFNQDLLLCSFFSYITSIGGQTQMSPDVTGTCALDSQQTAQTVRPSLSMSPTFTSTKHLEVFHYYDLELMVIFICHRKS